ncbi:MAG TPA: urease accessory protein UreF [Stellaceae bacterium]|nr:urease accessory protein UreF [Stellaceae bacterium]
MIIMSTTTITDAGFYRLLTWLSPSYPVGAFSYSHGIEYAVEAGLIADRDRLITYIATVLEQGSGCVDAALLSAAWHAADRGDDDRLDEVADLACAWRGTAELALEAETQGRAFLATTRAAWPHPRLDSFAARRAAGTIAMPVAVGVAAALHRLPLKLALTAFLHAFAGNLVSAGIRLIPMGQTDGQRAMAALEPAVASSVAAALATPLDEVCASAPVIDWCSMRHETQHTRLFRS